MAERQRRKPCPNATLSTIDVIRSGLGSNLGPPMCHTGLLTAWEQDQEVRPDPARKLSANLYDIYHCCVYSEKLLMMDRGTVRNM